MIHYLIDGYNLIYINESLKKHLLNNAQQARERFVEMISDFVGAKNIRTTIVFDGVESVDKNRHKPRPHIRVIYSHHHKADSEIKNLIDASKNQSKLIIVSNDNEIQNYAKVSGAKFIRAQEFFTKIKSRSGKKEFVKNSEITKGEVEYWLKIFNKN
ncbi:MAG: NYN domain-containing protein [Bacteroidota bacterium]